MNTDKQNPRLYESIFDENLFMTKGRARVGLGAGLAAAEQGRRLFADDFFATRYFLFALVQVIARDGLQIVNVIEVNVPHQVYFRVDVAWDSDVHQKQWTILAE